MEKIKFGCGLPDKYLQKDHLSVPKYGPAGYHNGLQMM